jgi:hypothetical protein
MWHSNLEKTFISQHVIHQHWYTCPIALPLRRNPQHRSLLTVVSATSAPPFQPLRRQRNVCHPAVNCFTRETLPTIIRKHFFMSIPCIESFCPQNTHDLTLLFGITLKRARHFDYWKQHVNMRIRMRVCYLGLFKIYIYKKRPRLSWSWTVLLPSDTYRKPITSITAVLLPFVTYLLTIPHVISSNAVFILF